MDIKKYISSGILVDYVLGLASEQDVREVERLSKLHPEIQEEIRAIQYSLEHYATKYKINPPPSLKEKIWSTIQKEEKVAHDKQGESAKIIRVNRYNYRKWLVAASVIFLIGSSILNITLFTKLQSVQKELKAINTEKEYYAKEFQIQKTVLEQTQNELAFLLQPATESIVLKGVPQFSDARVTVFWNKDSKEIYLAVNNLPDPPSDKQYQLWAITDGKPVDAGVFEVDESSLNAVQKMKTIESAQAFAITLEKKGGSPSPTLDAMYVIGQL
ncbi:MAG: anti-sigma factor domain-containing protein [Thermaurantimonas sp.]